MKRSVLNSFSAGSLVTSVAWLIGEQISQSDENSARRVISDKDWITPSKIRDLSIEEIEVQLSSAGFSRKCGAANFVTDWDGGSHTVPETFVEMRPESADTLNCILDSASNGSFPVNISFEAH